MPVHMAGLPCELDAIYAIATRHGIPVVEDAAHALGATYRETPIGACGDSTCFSFYAIKNITTMEGGIITLKDPERAERLRLLATNGMEASAWDRYGRSAVPAPQEVVVPGYKYAMGTSARPSALNNSRNSRLQAARKRLAHMYRAVLGDLEEISSPENPNTPNTHGTSSLSASSSITSPRPAMKSLTNSAARTSALDSTSTVSTSTATTVKSSE